MLDIVKSRLMLKTVFEVGCIDENEEVHDIAAQDDAEKRRIRVLLMMPVGAKSLRRKAHMCTALKDKRITDTTHAHAHEHRTWRAHKRSNGPTASLRAVRARTARGAARVLQLSRAPLQIRVGKTPVLHPTPRPCTCNSAGGPPSQRHSLCPQTPRA